MLGVGGERRPFSELCIRVGVGLANDRSIRGNIKHMDIQLKDTEGSRADHIIVIIIFLGLSHTFPL